LRGRPPPARSLLRHASAAIRRRFRPSEFRQEKADMVTSASRPENMPRIAEDRSGSANTPRCDFASFPQATRNASERCRDYLSSAIPENVLRRTFYQWNSDHMRARSCRNYTASGLIFLPRTSLISVTDLLPPFDRDPTSAFFAELQDRPRLAAEPVSSAAFGMSHLSAALATSGFLLIHT